MSLFSGVKSLTLIGSFDSISCLKDISEEIVSLELSDNSGRFDFYEMNQYVFSSLERFHLFTNRNVYINGYDCVAIKDVRDLGLYCYDPLSEIIFDGFGEFLRLKSLSLYHEDVPEFNYNDLVNNTSLDELIVKVPKFLSREIIKYIEHQIYDIPRVNVRYDDDPYDFTLLE